MALEEMEMNALSKTNNDYITKADLAAVIEPLIKEISTLTRAIHAADKKNTQLIRKVTDLESQLKGTSATPSPPTQTENAPPRKTPTTAPKPMNTPKPPPAAPKWTEVLKKGLKNQRKEDSPKDTPRLTNNQRTILLNAAPNSPEVDPVTLRDAINETLRTCKAPAHAVVSQVSRTPKGNYILTTRTDCPNTEVLAYKEQIGKTLHQQTKLSATLNPRESWHKVMVHAIDLTRYPDTDTGMKLLQREIEYHNPQLQIVGTPRYASRPEKRVGKLASSVVVAFAAEEAAKQSIRSGIVADGRRHRTEAFYPAKPTDQCNNCYNFGHSRMRCRGEATCAICSKNHSTREHNCRSCPDKKGKVCPHTDIKCVNCGGGHRATDATCPAKPTHHTCVDVDVHPEETQMIEDEL
jgi:hypothetical protein